MTNQMELSVVIPVFNEEEVLMSSYERLVAVMRRLTANFELIFVNDGSIDGTRSILNHLRELDAHVRVIHFSRNFGHQIAITAGVDYASGAGVVVIDADLQDPPELIPAMVEKWRAGYQVVYAKRLIRKGESFFKKFSAKVFYRALEKLSDTPIPVDTGDFRLMDRKVCRALRQVEEKNPFVRGQVSWLGFKQTEIEYERDERLYGTTKYPLRKMIKLSIDGITSFSYLPLKLATYLGVTVAACGFFYMFFALFQKLFTTATVPGWASIVIIQLIFFGIVLLVLGVIGEYIGRMYEEVKHRPLYVIDEASGFDVSRLYAMKEDIK
ncbi:glycosyl transferase group 2 [Listeria fleischmannii subsp. coloradonensis]|uniref:Glycosyltransferase family 2 protein n=1 Tax=Listeria fleischmannii TaxID=1069827 RepID=A0A841YF35_9LIST|nr:glycosyltransferase family 2 protein [Listeria fleischmannii]EIA20877.1 glycosyl transferase group 2 [Listeria fleischmannii subsp. coloradonensis]MBC1398886.1 glycosyltransferase family 2 protein [Listeria fleischmannii]MBC1427139.1 glycosyltransferase family 2 protein [Listeria fleischmannii]